MPSRIFWYFVCLWGNPLPLSPMKKNPQKHEFEKYSVIVRMMCIIFCVLQAACKKIQFLMKDSTNPLQFNFER